mmetsp:Transcript_25737/g.66291  ORF Transcript_25737/g.66291 Transcript_25737/m.66291 type:complete len:354 (-) Transcript_25737:421-1482(-)
MDSPGSSEQSGGEAQVAAAFTPGELARATRTEGYAPSPAGLSGGGGGGGGEPAAPTEAELAADTRAVLAHRPPFEQDIVKGHGARVVIKPHVWESRVVWAKLAAYPWWPGQVLSPNDPFIPPTEPAPRPDAVPVRFFGTYDFAWISSQRCLAPFYSGYSDKLSKSLADPEFIQAVKESMTFQKTGELPRGFELAMEEQDPVPPPLPLPPGAGPPATPRPIAATMLQPKSAADSKSKSSSKKSKSGSKAKAPAAAGGSGSKGGKSGKSAKKDKGGPKIGLTLKIGKGTAAIVRSEDKPAEGGKKGGKKRPAEEEQRVPQPSRALRVARRLALAPPAGSPYANTICLNPNFARFM